MTLKTNIYDFLKNYRVGVVTTETLGMAFEPEERFENPDGSDIVFDRDYHGRHRSLSTLPGPFAEGKSEARPFAHNANTHRYPARCILAPPY